MTKYEVYKKGDFTSVTKTTQTVRQNGDITTITIDCAHIKGHEFVSIRIAVHDWKGLDGRHAFFNARTIKEGWEIFRQLLDLYRMEG